MKGRVHVVCLFIAHISSDLFLGNYRNPRQFILLITHRTGDYVIYSKLVIMFLIKVFYKCIAISTNAVLL